MNAMLSTRLESALVMTHHKRECGSDLFAIARRDDVTSAFARQHCADRSAQEFVPGIVALAARNGRINMRPSSGMVWINQALIQGKGRDWALPAVSRRQAHDPWDVSTTRARLASSLRKVAPRSETTMRNAVS